MNRENCIEWMSTLRKNKDGLSTMLPRLWAAQMHSLNFFVKGDENILALQPLVRECHAMLLALRPPDTTELHPIMEQIIRGALDIERGMERGYRTSALRIVTCIALMVKMITAFFEIQHTLSYQYMSAPANQWLRTAYRGQNSGDAQTEP